MLRFRFGIGDHSGHTVKEVATSFALSRTRIYQIQAQALRRLCETHPVEVREFLRQLRQLPETRSASRSSPGPAIVRP